MTDLGGRARLRGRVTCTYCNTLLMRSASYRHKPIKKPDSYGLACFVYRDESPLDKVRVLILS